MRYTIQIVGEDELPQGMHMVIVEQCCDRPPLMLINGPHARGWQLMRAYEDAREPSSVPSVLLPAEPLRLAV